MNSIYRIFGKGLLTVLPIMVTLYLFVWLTAKAESFFGDPVRSVIPEQFYIPGSGLVIGLSVIFIVGLLVNNFISLRFVSWFEDMLLTLPVFKTIYGPLRDVMNLFARTEQSSLKRVVLVRLPGLGVEAIGLVTRDRFDDIAKGAIPPDHVAVLLPMSYMVGGITLIVPKANVREIALTPERAMQLSLTAWIKTEKPSQPSA